MNIDDGEFVVAVSHVVLVLFQQFFFVSVASNAKKQAEKDGGANAKTKATAAASVKVKMTPIVGKMDFVGAVIGKKKLPPAVIDDSTVEAKMPSDVPRKNEAKPPASKKVAQKEGGDADKKKPAVDDGAVALIPNDSTAGNKPSAVQGSNTAASVVVAAKRNDDSKKTDTKDGATVDTSTDVDVLASSAVVTPPSDNEQETEAANEKETQATKEKEFSLKQLLTDAENDTSLFTSEENTKKIRSYMTQTKSHMSRCSKLEERFFKCLEQHPVTSPLARFTSDKDGSNRRRVFYKEVAGEKDEKKERTLNLCLVVFAEKLRKDEKSVPKALLDSARTEEEKQILRMYQPNSLGTMHRQLFAHFKRNGIEYCQADFKHGKSGSFYAYWKHKMAEAAKVIDNYGRAPKRSEFDEDEDYKLRNCANPPWNFNEYNDLLHLIVWQLLTQFMLRGAQEVSFGVVFWGGIENFNVCS